MRRERRREEGVGGRGGKERLKLSLRKKKIVRLPKNETEMKGLKRGREWRRRRGKQR